MFYWKGPLMTGSGKRPQAAPSPSTALARLAAQTQLDFELDFFASLLDRHPDYVEVLKGHAKNLAAALSGQTPPNLLNPDYRNFLKA